MKIIKYFIYFTDVNREWLNEKKLKNIKKAENFLGFFMVWFLVGFRLLQFFAVLKSGTHLLAYNTVGAMNRLKCDGAEFCHIQIALRI